MQTNRVLNYRLFIESPTSQNDFSEQTLIFWGRLNADTYVEVNVTRIGEVPARRGVIRYNSAKTKNALQ